MVLRILCIFVSVKRLTFSDARSFLMLPWALGYLLVTASVSLIDYGILESVLSGGKYYVRSGLSV